MWRAANAVISGSWSLPARSTVLGVLEFPRLALHAFERRTELMWNCCASCPVHVLACLAAV